jgi:hypothetical protein
VRGWAGSECVEELGPGRRGRRPPGDRAVLGGAGRAGRRAGAALAGAPARPAGRSAMPAGGRSRRPAPAGLPRPATGHPGASARWSHPGRVGLLGSGAPLDDHSGGRRGAPTAGAIAAAPPGASTAARPGRRGRRPGRAARCSAARCTGVQVRDPAARKAARQRSVSGKARAKTAQGAGPHRPCRRLLFCAQTHPGAIHQLPQICQAGRVQLAASRASPCWLTLTIRGLSVQIAGSGRQDTPGGTPPTALSGEQRSVLSAGVDAPRRRGEAGR